MNKAQADIRRLRNPRKARLVEGFFKTGPGQYGEGDRFLGVTVPQARALARRHRDIGFPAVQGLMRSPWHEERLLGLLILVDRFGRGTETERENIYRFTLRHLDAVNNWDLVDLSAPAIVGAHLRNRDKAPLRRWARSPNLWERRIAVLAAGAFIREGRFRETLRLARMLLADREDLIHKAVGWMLREVGKRDRTVLERFLDEHAERMPRTMLRYAIERFEAKARRRYRTMGKGRA